MWANIRIRVETYEKLRALKEQGYGKTYDEIIAKLISEHEALEKLDKMKKLMEFKEAWSNMWKKYRELEQDEEIGKLIKLLL